MDSHSVQPTAASVIPKIADAVAYAANMTEIDWLVKTTKYRHIVGWGKWLGFTPDTVQRELTQAENDNVSIDVVQKPVTGGCDLATFKTIRTDCV